ncbi:MAG: MTH1187 family thiamine-binding protein [bacterium]|nr:MTH1187 family thiamine-binding protein [bacterium]
MSNNVIAEITVVPLGTGTPSLSTYVAGVEKVPAKYPAVKSMLTPMSTVLEGPLDDLLKVARDMHEAPFTAGAQRVSTRIGIDDRRDKAITMEGKIQAVKSKLKQ